MLQKKAYYSRKKSLLFLLIFWPWSPYFWFLKVGSPAYIASLAEVDVWLLLFIRLSLTCRMRWHTRECCDDWVPTLNIKTSVLRSPRSGRRCRQSRSCYQSPDSRVKMRAGQTVSLLILILRLLHSRQTTTKYSYNENQQLVRIWRPDKDLW